MLLLLAACTSHPLDASIAPSEHVAIAFRVSVDAPPGTATVWWSERGEDDVAGPPTSVDGPVELPLIGVPAGESVRWWVEVEDDDGVVWRSPQEALEVPAPPADLPGFSPDLDEPEATMGDAYVLLSRFDNPGASHVVIADARGRIVWWQPDDGLGRITRVRPLPDGTGVIFQQEGRLVEQSFDGTTRRETAIEGGHHDLRPLGDGAALSLTHVVVRGTIEGFGDTVYVDDRLSRVQLGSPDPREAELLFSYDDDYPIAPWAPCPHVEDTEFVDDAHEWTHANSLVPADDGGWWIMTRWLDALVHVDADGVFVEQIGGRDGTWTVDPGATFQHAHMSWSDPGPTSTRMWVFDNGWDHSSRPVPTRLLELELDPVRKHVTLLTEIVDPLGFGHTNFLGDVTPLPGTDHLLTSWAAKAAVLELDADGTPLWGLQTSGAIARVHRLDTLYAP
ncbi:MAG: aryl-sulfate sulfotransferase [Myxococcales bacterium]|nr:aryl-sulfate sulfotransferase [Myxococcales bacterium]